MGIAMPELLSSIDQIDSRRLASAEDGSQFNMVCEDLSEKCELGDPINACSIVGV